MLGSLSFVFLEGLFEKKRLKHEFEMLNCPPASSMFFWALTITTVIIIQGITVPSPLEKSSNFKTENCASTLGQLVYQIPPIFSNPSPSPNFSKHYFLKKIYFWNFEPYCTNVILKIFIYIHIEQRHWDCLHEGSNISNILKRFHFEVIVLKLTQSWLSNWDSPQSDCALRELCAVERTQN